MKLFNKLTYIIIAGVVVGSCSLLGSGGGDGDSTFVLTTSVSPSGAGSVSPDSAEFDNGEEVRVRATPAFGFGFVEWTGDIQSTENPLTFEIDSDTDLTANFEQTRDTEYTMNFIVEDDSSNQQELRFGQEPDATEGFDQGIDAESPPPPAGGLHNFFVTSTDSLLYDFRSSTPQTITWNLQLFQSEGDSLFFSWTLDEDFLNGSLTLRNNDSSISVDMLDESSLEIAKTDADELFIDYEINN